MVMARYINNETGGKERNRLCKSIVLSIRELMKQQQPDDTSRDLAAFIALSLLQVFDTIDQSVAAWEKKDYWVKADRYRREWEWSRSLGEKMKQAVLKEDWATIAVTAALIAQKLYTIKIGERHRLGSPWVGAWNTLKNQ
jgi:hypothetical protein